MLIIAGNLFVAPEARAEYVESHVDVVRRARNQPGCVDLAISTDPVEDGRVNIFEQWESEEHLAAWRVVAGSPAPATKILGGDVQKYQIGASGPAFD